MQKREHQFMKAKKPSQHQGEENAARRMRLTRGWNKKL